MSESLAESLQGKVAIVTGAGRGIGRAFALALVAEGMRVGICARTKSQLDETVEAITAAGGVCHAASSSTTLPKRGRVAGSGRLTRKVGGTPRRSMSAARSFARGL